ncbi:hypothetical protein [Streptomyces sp. NPDC057681]|uniref:hypothetical protein n=1 Tax=unclassified Streptomyces TaxID=2593676 RepID=UPI003684A8FE
MTAVSGAGSPAGVQPQQADGVVVLMQLGRHQLPYLVHRMVRSHRVLEDRVVVGGRGVAEGRGDEFDGGLEVMVHQARYDAHGLGDPFRRQLVQAALTAITPAAAHLRPPLAGRRAASSGP